MDMEPAGSLAIVAINGRIARITLNRPKAFNALSQAMLEALQNAVDTVSADPTVRVVIMQAEGRGFCAGHDLKEMAARRSDADEGRDYYQKLFSDCSRLMLSITQSPKIFIAKIHGIATAAGCQLTAACDLAVASDQAKFGVNGINAGLFCSTPMVSLSRNVGRKKAMELLTTGHLMSVKEALANDLINKVTSVDDLEAETMALAEAVAVKSARVLALGKTAFYRQLELPLDEAYDYTSKVIVENMMMEDAVCGIDAFVNKQKPEFKD